MPGADGDDVNKMIYLTLKIVSHEIVRFFLLILIFNIFSNRIKLKNL